jgi:HSP20 family molecular chaperone IbpA
MAFLWPQNPEYYVPTPFNQHHATPHHFVHSTLPSLFSHAFRSSNMMNPEIDIRETNFDYWVDISLPGVSDRDSITIESLNTRELVVSSKIERPPIPGVDTTEAAAKNSSANHELGQESHGRTAAPPQHGKLTTPDHEKTRLLIAERNVGLFHRTLSFPLDVDRGAIQAKLSAGLLRIHVPKLTRNAEAAKSRIKVSD